MKRGPGFLPFLLASPFLFTTASFSNPECTTNYEGVVPGAIVESNDPLLARRNAQQGGIAYRGEESTFLDKPIPAEDAYVLDFIGSPQFANYLLKQKTEDGTRLATRGDDGKIQLGFNGKRVVDLLLHPDTREFVRKLPPHMRRLALESLADYAQVDVESFVSRISALPPEKLAELTQNSRVFADHGTGHVMDIVASTRSFLDRMMESDATPMQARLGTPGLQTQGTGLLVARRTGERRKSMHDLATMLVLMHDRAMKDLTKQGRALHPQRAGQMPFKPGFEETLDSLWEGSPMAQRLRGRYGEAGKEAFRELLALSVAHSKSRVPIEVVNSPRLLAMKLRSLLSVENFMSKEELATKFKWLEEMRANDPLFQDIADVLRALRGGDVLRQRGHALRTSGGHQILFNPATSKAEIVLIDPEKNRTIYVDSSNPFTVGESNLYKIEMGADGKLHFHLHAPGNNEVAKAVAMVINDVKKDLVDSMYGARGGRVSSPQDIEIVIHQPVPYSRRPAGAPSVRGFADNVSKELKKIFDSKEKGVPFRATPKIRVANAEGARRKNGYDASVRMEHSRFLTGNKVNVETARKLATELIRTGVRFEGGEPNPQIKDSAKAITILPGESLVEPGAQPNYVYIIPEKGFVGDPVNTNQRFDVPPFGLIGATGVLRGKPRNARILNNTDRPITVYAVKATVFEQWHAPYSEAELPTYFKVFQRN